MGRLKRRPEEPGVGEAASASDRGTNGSTVRTRPALVSASRRTDIPQFYSRWFAERRKVGFAVFRTAFGTPGRASLRPEDVLAYLFWTKYAGPFHPILQELQAEGTPFAFQYTINGYGPTLEPQIPPLHLVLQDIEAVRLRLPSTACLEWRYDPIVLSREWPAAWHLRNFGALARALQGVVSIVNVSVVEPYVKTVRRMGSVAAEVLYRNRRGVGVHRSEGIEAAGSETATLLGELQGLAAENRIEPQSLRQPRVGLASQPVCVH